MSPMGHVTMKDSNQHNSHWTYTYELCPRRENYTIASISAYYISNALLVTAAVHLKMKLGDNTPE